MNGFVELPFGPWQAKQISAFCRIAASSCAAAAGAPSAVSAKARIRWARMRRPSPQEKRPPRPIGVAARQKVRRDGLMRCVDALFAAEGHGNPGHARQAIDRAEKRPTRTLRRTTSNRVRFSGPSRCLPGRTADFRFAAAPGNIRLTMASPVPPHQGDRGLAPRLPANAPPRARVGAAMSRAR